MVAAAKLRRAQEQIEAARPYSEKIAAVVRNLAERTEFRNHPLLQHREVKNKHILLMTSDRGLCGGFNSNLIRAAELYIKEQSDSVEGEIGLTCVGRKGYDYFRRRNFNIRNSYVGLGGNFEGSVLGELTEKLLEGYCAEEYDAVTVIFSEFKSAIAQEIITHELLPLSLPQREKPELLIDYIYEPAAETIINEILPASIESQLWRGLLDTTASEHGARMSAMEAATTNASEMIDKLTLTYNRARQEAITTELMDIVGGAEALNG